jgi:hypothetical protein
MQIANAVFINVEYFLRAYGGVEVQRHLFLASALHGIGGQLFTAGKMCRYAFSGWLVGIHSRFERFEKEEISCSCQESNYDSLVD